ncbi:hypothetical protein [Azospirillum sp.]|uniref:hypothetical protein n=1 Tax=Azospirillum sp. TaxID=34012 RepID=UPI003D71DE2D
MFKGNALFEVQVRVDDRWRMEATFTEEQAALSCARVQMTVAGVQEVKVFKSRSLAGLAIQTAIFHRKVPEQKSKPLTIAGTAEGAPYCTELADLYGFESRVVIGRLLRQFLDKFQVTPTELLHGWTYARKLDEQGTLMGAAIHAVARHHGDTRKVAVAARVKELRALVDRALVRARDFNAERKRLPAFDESDLAATSRRIGQAVGAEEHDFVFLAMLSQYLTNANSLAGKMELLVKMMARTDDPHLSALLEGVVADGLGAADVVKELLGAQPTLAAGLCALADTLYGRRPGEKDVPVHPLLACIGALTVTGRAPSCRIVLLERVRSALNSDQPLDRKDAKAEAALVETLALRLKGADGTLLGGAETEKALAKRLLRHRQAILRQQGMHDIADRLAGTLRPGEG